MFFLRVCEHLRASGIPFAVVGGYAVALHGAVRGTMDLDLIIQHEEAAFTKLSSALQEIGFVSRLPVTAKEVFQFRKEYIEKRNLVAWSFYNQKNQSEIVDVVITHDLDGVAVKNIKLGSAQVDILCKKDLIQMKKDAGRPQDLADVKALERLNTHD